MAIPESFSPIYFQRYKNYSINRFSIIGERHSGTNWLEHLIQCRLTIPITFEFGSKHFIETLNPHQIADAQNCLFICITRNIYDWIGGFYKLPHHVDKSLCPNIKTFITSEWNCGDIDYFITPNQKYLNIFHLRSTKLFFYYFCLPLIANNLLIIRYEDLKYPENFISYISYYYKISKTNHKYSKITSAKYKKPYYLNNSILQIINSNTDWTTEQYYRYYPDSRL